VSLFGSGRREGLLAVLTLLLMSIALHAPGLFLGMPRAPSPDSTWSERACEQYTNIDTLVPAMRAAGVSVRNGEAPLWNAASRLGEPFLVSGAPVLYPPYWLLMSEGGSHILDLLLCLHTFLAAMCMFRFCRIIPLSRYVSFLAGSLYGLGWFMTAQLDRLPDAAAAAILPLALEFTWRVVTTRKRMIYAGWLSVVATLMLATGGTGTAVLGLALCLGLFFHGLWALDRDSQNLACRSMAFATGLTVLLTAPIWIHYVVHLPFLLVATDLQSPHLQISGLLGVLSPIAFGGLVDGATANLRMVNPAADALELVLFPGTIVLFLGVLGLLRPKRTTLGLFWITVGGIGLLLSLDGPTADFARGLAPLVLAAPGVALVLVHVAFVVLAAASLESFFEAPVARPFAVPVTSGIALCLSLSLLMLGFVFPEAGAACVSTFVSGTGAEIRAAMDHLRYALLPTAIFGAAISLLFLIWRRMGMIRFKLGLEILVIADLLTVAIVNAPRSEQAHGESYLTARIPESSGRAVIVGRDAQVSSTPLLLAGTPTITSTTPAILSRTCDLLSAIDPSVVLIDHKARVIPLQAAPLLQGDLLDIACIGIALTGQPQRFPGFESLAPTPAVENYRVDAGHIHYRTEPVRRARICFDAIHVDTRAEARDALTANRDRLGYTVVLEGADRSFTCRQPEHEPRITFIEDAGNTVRIRVAMGEGRGHLVLADAFAPGWVATLDGKPVRIHPANVALRSIPLSEGIHEVTFRYSPWMCRLGMPIALFGLLLLIGWLELSRRRRR
jgi:hypothetical protein